MGSGKDRKMGSKGKVKGWGKRRFLFKGWALVRGLY